MKSRLKCAPIKKDWASGNEAKYYAYKEAWTRIRLSIKQKYYLEAVTIEESILSDRMTSFVTKKSIGSPKKNTLDNFHNLVGEWARLSLTCATSEEDCDLINTLKVRIDAWRKKRNDIVHGIVKSKVAHKEDHVTNFMEDAHDAAVEGEALAKAISSWCSKQLKRNKTISKD